MLSVLLLMAAGIACANVIERPIFHQFKNQEKPFVWSYIQFGTFPNGAKAIVKVGQSRALFYERNLRINPDLNFYYAMELDCSLGIVYVVGLGPLDHIVAMSKEVSKKIQDGHVENIPTYRKVCEAADLVPGNWSQ